MAHNWNTSSRKSRLPADWEKRRKQVIERDVVCQICFVRVATVADHIVPMTDNHDLDALQGACDPCHRVKTAKEAAAARAAQPRPTARRGDEPHPGLL
ncbi:HNH endonuclease [Streptomyces sp. AN091965]|uniref:HNH endonuclease n=1 Tax=Streptomyces sp. AN091965 TaxID=2927803 RepID=UPI001F62428E|nr:HNH endonuclease signature motif containing protein [Streptomyces sp. AN091965]MCI3930188.1 HNH endonuclease [Streptomyces sp. AN091965]